MSRLTVGSAATWQPAPWYLRAAVIGTQGSQQRDDLSLQIGSTIADRSLRIAVAAGWALGGQNARGSVWAGAGARAQQARGAIPNPFLRDPGFRLLTAPALALHGTDALTRSVSAGLNWRLGGRQRLLFAELSHDLAQPGTGIYAAPLLPSGGRAATHLSVGVRWGEQARPPQ